MENESLKDTITNLILKKVWQLDKKKSNQFSLHDRKHIKYLKWDILLFSEKY